MRRSVSSRKTKDEIELVDLGFLPKELVSQCYSLIEGYHSLYGYLSLANTLWRAGFGPVVKKCEPLNQLLQTASKTRSARKANRQFNTIAATTLAVEVIARGSGGWSTAFPVAATEARNLIAQYKAPSETSLLDFYSSSPDHSSAIAALSFVRGP